MTFIDIEPNPVLGPLRRTGGIANLLSQISAIEMKYETIAELSGENFNLFKILKVQSSEVRLHSALIGELLNPKGSHGQKHSFLKLFVEMFCNENPINIHSCRVQVEKHAGSINEIGTEGGRIDISITDNSGNHIIIENKIYAGDQENQLVRYSNVPTKGDLIYLTLYGDDPSPSSRGNLEKGVHFECRSYHIDILKWLYACRKEVAMNPIIRESITQYINLIKYLTNQAINQNMEREISKAIRRNWEASFDIAGNFDRAKNELIDEFSRELSNSITNLGLICKCEINLKRPYTGITVYRKDWKFVNVRFEFQGTNSKLIYGFCIKQDHASFPIELRAALNLLSTDRMTSGGWPWYNSVEEPFDNWGKFEAFEAMQSGSMKESFLEKIELLLKVSKKIEGLL